MERIRSLDGLKGICAIAVFISHFALAFYKVFPAWNDFYFQRPCFQWFEGDTAVNVFILISSFLVVSSLQKSSVQDVLLKRYFRLLLPSAVVLLIMGILFGCNLLLNKELGELSSNGWLVGGELSYTGLVKAIIFSPLGHHFGWMNVLWMMGYIYWGTILVICLKVAFQGMILTKQLLSLFVLCLFFCKYDPYYINVLWGYTLWIILDQGASLFHTASFHRCMCSFVPKISLAGLLLMDFAPKIEGWNLLRSICLVNLAILSPLCAKVLSWNPLVFMGKISMEIYLLQLPIIYSLSCYLWMKTEDMILTTILSIVVLFISSWLFYQYVNPLLNVCVWSIVKKLKS